MNILVRLAMTTGDAVIGNEAFQLTGIAREFDDANHFVDGSAGVLTVAGDVLNRRSGERDAHGMRVLRGINNGGGDSCGQPGKVLRIRLDHANEFATVGAEWVCVVLAMMEATGIPVAAVTRA